METGELDFLDLDFENEAYYEVEIWEGGDCDGHFFHYKRDAARYFDKHAKNPGDCIKFRHAETDGGDCELIKEAR